MTHLWGRDGGAVVSACMLNRKHESRMSSDAPVGKRWRRRGKRLHAEAEAQEVNE